MMQTSSVRAVRLAARPFLSGPSRVWISCKRYSNMAKFSRIPASFVAVPLVATLCVAGAINTLSEERLDRWIDRWKDGRTGWHRTVPNEFLVQYYVKFIGATATSHRVLVPLCGKSVDMPYLAEKGHEVVGVEGAEAAAWQLQRDAWLTFQTSQVHAPPDASDARKEFIPASTFGGAREGYVFKTDSKGTGYYLDSKSFKLFHDAKKKISMVVADFFSLGSRDIGMFDRIWDRGSLVAIRPSDRETYVTRCDELLEPGGRILLVTMDYNQEQMKGPPYSIPLEEVNRLYGKLGYKMEILCKADVGEKYKYERKSNMGSRPGFADNERFTTSCVLFPLLSAIYLELGPQWDALADGLHEVVLLITKPAASSRSWWRKTFSRTRGSN